MSGRRCPICGSVVYGRSDKQYCSATCRRDACRVRTRIIRLGGMELKASEWSDSKRFKAVLIPQLERDDGPNHRLVQDARRLLEELQEAKLERIAQKMARLGL